MQEEMFLKVGADVHFQDGKGGTLHKIVVDPQTGHVTDLVVLRGFLQRHDYVIPVSAVQSVTPNDIHMAPRIEELTGFPEYREVEFDEWVDDWDSELAYPREHVVVWYPQAGVYERGKKVIPAIRRRHYFGIPTGEVVIDRASTIRTIYEEIGKVDHLWLDRNTWGITHLVVRRGIVPHYVIIPFSLVNSISSDEIYVRNNGTQFKEIPVAQFHLDKVHDTRETELAYGLEQGLDQTHATLDENLAIAQAITDALAADPRTAAAVIEVVYEHGIVTLLGNVESEFVHTVAEEIAHNHARVLSVVNALEVHPEPSRTEKLTSVLGTIQEWATGGPKNR